MKKKWSLICGIALGALLCMTLQAWANDFPDLSASELKARIDSGEEIALVNPLSEIIFNQGFIPGSLNIPLEKIASSPLLPENKDTLIVTYCLGVK